MTLHKKKQIKINHVEDGCVVRSEHMLKKHLTEHVLSTGRCSVVRFVKINQS